MMPWIDLLFVVRDCYTCLFFISRVNNRRGLGQLASVEPAAQNLHLLKIKCIRVNHDKSHFPFFVLQMSIS